MRKKDKSFLVKDDIIIDTSIHTFNSLVYNDNWDILYNEDKHESNWYTFISTIKKEGNLLNEHNDSIDYFKLLSGDNYIYLDWNNQLSITWNIINNFTLKDVNDNSYYIKDEKIIYFIEKKDDKEVIIEMNCDIKKQ